MLLLLLEKGAGMAAKCGDKAALCAAAENGHEKIVRLLPGKRATSQ